MSWVIFVYVMSPLGLQTKISEFNSFELCRWARQIETKQYRRSPYGVSTCLLSGMGVRK